MTRFFSKTLLMIFLSTFYVSFIFAQDPVPTSDSPATAETTTDADKKIVNINSTSILISTETAEQSKTTVTTINKGDDAFIMMCAAFVIFMSIPGLALFYGGLVRKKNMLSVLMQVFSVFSLISILWVLYGYSLAFGDGNPYIGDFSKVMLAGVTTDSVAATFTEGVGIHEFIFIVFQGAFAAITCGLILGSFAERIKFSAVLIFCVIWFTCSYIPIAHMVWGSTGYLLKLGALDFAGGTVVHINAAVAGLIGAYFVGKRRGFGKQAMSPHSLTMTMIGASMLWFGWFGFNAGSALEANGTACLAFLNTWLAASMATISWVFAEWLFKGKPSVLGAASGAVAGLVAITPACGLVGVGGALIIGLLAGVVCLVGVHKLKGMLGADDSLDVFGIHGVGGILGAILTGVFNITGTEDYSIGGQVWIQTKAILITIVLSGVVSIIAYKLIDLTIGLRVEEDDEMMGLDITSHGESAYND